MIVIVSAGANSIQCLMIGVLMKTVMPVRPVFEKETPKSPAKKVVGILLIIVVLCGYGYGSLAILAHFPNTVRNEWIKNFFISFAVDNVIAHSIKVLATGTILSLIVKRKVSEKMREKLLKLLDKNMVLMFNINK